ncbi:hypothetical protein Tco_1457378 [Tanacetum coccineum]
MSERILQLFICKESNFHSNKTPQVSLVFAITSTLPSIEPNDSLIMGDDHLSTFSAEEIVLIPRESEDTSRSDSKNVLPSYDDFSSINVPRDDSVTFSNSLFEFDVNNDDLFDLESKENDWKKILYDAPIDKAGFFDPGGEIDEIDAFLAIEIPTYIEEGYYDLEGDILYLESLLSDDNTHNLSSEVFFDHEPQHIKNESNHDTLITFSPKNDPLHYEFTGGVITIPPGIVREHEDYINSTIWEVRLMFEVDDSITICPLGIPFLSYLTYPEVSPLLSSTENEDTIFDPDIST